jgi:hypothetical protein
MYLWETSYKITVVTFCCENKIKRRLVEISVLFLLKMPNGALHLGLRNLRKWCHEEKYQIWVLMIQLRHSMWLFVNGVKCLICIRISTTKHLPKNYKPPQSWYYCSGSGNCVYSSIIHGQADLWLRDIVLSMRNHTKATGTYIHIYKSPKCFHVVVLTG